MRLPILIVLSYLLFGVGLVQAEEVLQVMPAEQTVVVTGYTRSEKTVTITAEVTGKVMAVNYDTGGMIGEAPLVVIDPTFINFKIARIRGQIRQLEVALAQARSKAAFLKREWQRIEALFQRKVAPKTKRDAAEEEHRQAALAIESVQAEQALHVNDLNELLERQQRHTIAAPVGWRITQRKVEVGDIVQVGGALAEVADFQRLVVPLALTATELQALQALPAIFPVTVADQPATATLHWVNPKFIAQSRKIAVEIILEEYQGPKRGGLPFAVTLKMPLAALQVPKVAVTDRYANPTVTLQANGKKVPIIILEQSATAYTIAATPALQPGLKLIRPSASVQVDASSH